MNPLLLLTLILLTIGVKNQPKLPRHIIPLHGNASLGYYYANLYIGTPPQEQSVIVDTGSGLLAMPCSKCQSCGYKHIQVPFRLSDSKTSKFITCNSQQDICASCPNKDGSEPCRFSISYAEGSSLSGIIIEDQIQFQGTSQGESIKASFGCTTRETNLFFSQAANGIFGLAPNRQAKLLEKIYEQHSPFTGQKLLFSMCLSKNGGRMVVGKPQEQYHLNRTSVKTRFAGAHNLYNLEGVGQIRIGQKLIKGKGERTGAYGIFIDSGSTFTYLPRNNFNTLLNILDNACALYPNQCLIAKNKGSCFKITPQSNQTILRTIKKIFPSIDIEINGEIVPWNSKDYFLLRNLNGKQVCIGIEQLDRFILGANWMVNRDIIFNLQHRTVEIFSGINCNDPVHSRMPLLQEIAVFTQNGKNQEFSYIPAMIRQNNQWLGLIAVLLVTIGVIMIALVLIGKFCNDQQLKIAPKHITLQQSQENQLSERKSLEKNKESPNEIQKPQQKIQTITISDEEGQIQQKN